MPRIVIIGPPGSGKTTVGRALASALGTGFRDTDEDIVTAQGKPISDIFIEDGEEHFRALERAAVARALAEHDGVLALGGGSILAAETRELLAGQTVVYLKIGLSAAVERVGLATARPLLVLNPRSQLRKLMEERRPLYEGLATLIVAADEGTPEELAAKIVKDLG